MKAAIAVLADIATHNVVRKLAWEVHMKYRTGTNICRLPPHVSLKQPFDIESLAELETYLDEFATSIRPFEIQCTALQLVATSLREQKRGCCG